MMRTTSTFVRNLAVVGVWGGLWGWVRNLHVLYPEAALSVSCFLELLPEVPTQPERGQAVPVAGPAAAAQHT